MNKKIFIGPAGTNGSDDINFIHLKENNLDAVEFEFTYGVWLKKEDAQRLNNLNKKLNLNFSIHAPYFINLNSKEFQKIQASKKRILKSCEIGNYLGAKNIVFHAGFYQGQDKLMVYERIKEQIKELVNEVKKNKYNVLLSPETTGKPTQFGDLDELIKLKKETGCSICIDFAHLKARNLGKINYDEVMKKIKPLGKIHSHFSGIEYGNKGEKKHLLTKKEDIEELFFYLKKYDISATIINESPEPFEDSLKMKKIRDKIFS